jgi:hypothetical protein
MGIKYESDLLEKKGAGGCPVDKSEAGRSEEQEGLVVDRSDDDVFAASSLSQCLSSTLTLHDGCADARMVSETIANGSSIESARDIHGVNGTSMIAGSTLPVPRAVATTITKTHVVFLRSNDSACR